MADTATAWWRRHPLLVSGVVVLWVYTVAHFLHAAVGYRSYSDYLLLMNVTREWLVTGQFNVGYWYPPFFFLVNSPLALWFDDQTAALVMLAINHALLVVCLGLLMAATAARIPGRAWWWLLLPLALNFRPLLLLVSMAKIEMAEVTLLVGAMLAVQRGRDRLAGSLAALAGMLKPLPVLFALYFIWTRRWRLVRAWAVSVAAILLVSGLVFGFEAVGAYFSTVIQPRGDNAFYWYEDQSLLGVAVRWWHPIRPNEFHVPLHQVRLEGLWMGWVLRFLAAGWLAVLLARRRDASPQRLWAEWSIVSAGMLLLSPMSRDYYAVFLLPGYLLLAGLWWQRGSRFNSAACWSGVVSYLLVGQGVPLGIINQLPSVIPGVLNSRAYLYYGIPTLGYVVFIIAWTVTWRQERQAAAFATVSQPPASSVGVLT
ncbi:MAG: DUF2029 domain-containing protein [Candidatus Omnitrophica bacterium]|nr:DUF2029 domain-containing protein [Candidatus Omnitrophota bacterium]